MAAPCQKEFWTIQERRLTSLHSFLDANPSLCLEPWGGSGGRGEERVTGGASRTARLQYLSAPETGGHQPRNRHDVNDPLLLALQKELTSNLLWVLVFLLLPQQSAQWAPKRMGRCRQMAKS